MSNETGGINPEGVTLTREIFDISQAIIDQYGKKDSKEGPEQKSIFAYPEDASDLRGRNAVNFLQKNPQGTILITYNRAHDKNTMLYTEVEISSSDVLRYQTTSHDWVGGDSPFISKIDEKLNLNRLKELVESSKDAIEKGIKGEELIERYNQSTRRPLSNKGNIFNKIINKLGL